MKLWCKKKHLFGAKNGFGLKAKKQLYRGRIFLEIILNLNPDTTKLLEFFYVNDINKKNFFMNFQIRQKIIFLNLLVQCDIFSTCNLIKMIKNRKNSTLKNFFYFLSGSIHCRFFFLFFYKNTTARIGFDVFKFYCFFFFNFIKFDSIFSSCVYSDQIFTLNSNTKKKSIKTCMLLEFYLNGKTKNTHSHFFEICLCCHFLGIYQNTIIYFLFRIVLFFDYIVENLFIYFKNKLTSGNSLLTLKCVSDFRLNKIKTDIKSFTVFAQSLESSVNFTKFFFLILKNFKTFKLTASRQRSSHFLFKSFVKKIKFYLQLYFCL